MPSAIAPPATSAARPQAGQKSFWSPPSPPSRTVTAWESRESMPKSRISVPMASVPPATSRQSGVAAPAVEAHIMTYEPLGSLSPVAMGRLHPV